MVKVNDPPKQTLKSDIEIFAKAYFGIELTSYQMDYIRALANPRRHNVFRINRRAGITTADKVFREYINQGLDVNGRMRMPMTNLPKHEKPKGKTQEARVLEMVKRPGGAFNFELSRYSLRYGHFIYSLRLEGHNIVTERQFLKNGRASNTYRYYLIGE